MTSIKFVTWNVRGLRDRVKRTAVLTYLKSQKADITALVETHITGHLQTALKKTWVGWSYQSRGVSIIIAKKVQFELVSLESDQQGRFLFLNALIGGNPLLVLASYIPPPFALEVERKGLAFLARNPSTPAVWMGDFNMVMNPALDRPLQEGSPRSSLQHTRLSRLLTEFALTDVWRWHNPSTRAYTCHSVGHHTMSRIDYVLVTNTLLPKVTGSGIAPRALSDHAPCWIMISLLKSTPTPVW